MPRRKSGPKPEYLFALDSFAAREPGSKYPTNVPKGSAWHADAPIVLAYPDMFSETPTEVFPRGWVPKVEQATDAPGELRDTERGD